VLGTYLFTEVVREGDPLAGFVGGVVSCNEEEDIQVVCSREVLDIEDRGV
jgi:hypothetical protein